MISRPSILEVMALGSFTAGTLSVAVVCPGGIASRVVAATTISLHAQRWTKPMSRSCAEVEGCYLPVYMTV